LYSIKRIQNSKGGAMDFTIPEEYRILKDTARRFAENELLPYELEVEKTRVFPQKILDKMKELGFYGMTIPQEYGGMNIGCLGYSLVMEELCRVPGPWLTGVTVANGIGSQAIVLDGSEEQKRKYLPPIAKGEKMSAFALTEPNAGSDAANIQTTAVRKGDFYVVNGSKIYISNGHVADILTLMALTDREKRAKGGITAFILEKGMPGFRVAGTLETMAGPPPVQAELVFEDCMIPAENRIGEEGMGFVTAMKTLDRGRVTLAANCLGIAQRCLDMAVEYSKIRVQFGRPICHYQGVQWLLAESATEIYAARMMVYNAATRVDQGEKIPMESAMVKLFASEMACRVADRALQVHGGMGYMKECPIERLYRAVRIMRIVEGTSEIQKIVIARELTKK
jgi:acyl-CoA dehydrogenase